MTQDSNGRQSTTGSDWDVITIYIVTNNCIDNTFDAVSVPFKYYKPVYFKKHIKKQVIYANKNYHIKHFKVWILKLDT